MKSGGKKQARTFVGKNDLVPMNSRELLHHLGAEPPVYFSEGVGALAYGGREHPPLRRVDDWNAAISSWLPAELVLCAALAAPVVEVFRRGEVELKPTVLGPVQDGEGEVAVLATRGADALRLCVIVWRHGMTIHLMEEREVYLATQ